MNEVDELLNFILSLLNIKSIDDDPKENQKQLAFLYKFIIDKYHYLTIEEIKEAFRMYVANQFETKVFRILDCIVVGEVLTSYTEYRNNQLKNYVPKQELKPKLEIITNSAKEEINKSAVNRVFEEYKQSNEIPEGLGYIYDILVEYGLIKVPGENTPKLSAYYDKMITKAKDELKKETESELNKAKAKYDKSNVFSLSNALKQLEENGNYSLVVSRTKKLILKEFFITKIIDNQQKIF